MKPHRQQLGQWGERVAGWWLRRQGYQILLTNYHCRGGEVDLVASHKGQLAFFEVKTRRHTLAGHPEEAFGRLKQYRFQKAIDHYLAMHAPDAEVWQVGLIAITHESRRVMIRLIWY